MLIASYPYFCLDKGMEFLQNILSAQPFPDEKYNFPTEQAFVQNMIDVIKIWERYQIVNGAERVRLELSTAIPVCSSYHPFIIFSFS